MTSAGGGSEGGGVAVCCFIYLPCPAMSKCSLGTATVDSVPQDYLSLVILAMSESTSKY
jgi:hypothetical protein